MCFNPRTIKNIAYDPTDPLSSEFVTVPCGHCPDCVNGRIGEVLFRCDYQSDYVKSFGGYAVFATLTFNEDSLNYIEYADDDGFIRRVSTWNNSKFRTWRNGLNMWLKRSYNCQFHYLCTSERGGNQFYTDSYGKLRQATSRPHYHVIIWITPSDANSLPSEREVFEKIACLWSWKVRGNHALDISDFNSPGSRFVAHERPVGIVYNEIIDRSSDEASKYVAKYCFKDVNETLFNLDQLKILSSKFELDYLDMCPRFRCSNGIGVSFELGYDFSDPSTAALFANRIFISSDGSERKIPRYYLKRHNSIQGETYTEYCVDDTLIFTKKGFKYKFAHENDPLVCDGTITKPLSHFTSLPYSYVVANPNQKFFLSTEPKFFYNYRTIRHLHSVKSRFGRQFNTELLNLRIQNTWLSLQNWLVQPFIFEDDQFDELIFSGYLDDNVYRDAHHVLSFMSFKQEIQDRFRNISFEQFDNVYRSYWHIDSSLLDDLRIHARNDYLDIFYLSLFCDFRRINTMLTSALNLYLNEKQYIEGIFNAIEERPRLFKPRLIEKCNNNTNL